MLPFDQMTPKQLRAHYAYNRQELALQRRALEQAIRVYRQETTHTTDPVALAQTHQLMVHFQTRVEDRKNTLLQIADLLLGFTELDL